MIKNISKSAMNVKQIYSIDGNIASGKSMILDHLSKSKYQNAYCMQEPVAEWSNMKSGTNLLSSFYENKERWSFCFENLVQLSRLKSHYQSLKLVNSQPFLQKQKDRKVFLERSIYSSFHVFTQNTYDDFGINNIEFDILKEYFHFFTNDLNSMFNWTDKNNPDSLHLPFKLIYIRSSPDVCFERMKNRNRLSEDLISRDYLNSIHLKYEDWISKQCKDNVAVIDGNKSKEEVLQQINNIVLEN